MKPSLVAILLLLLQLNLTQNLFAYPSNSSVSYPENNDIAIMKPLYQDYYVVYFAWENSVVDLCSPSMAPYDCLEYFCGCSISPSTCYNLSLSLIGNETFRMEYSLMFNYCLHCRDENTDRFRNEMANSSSSCSTSFPSLENVQNSLREHCNQDSNSDSLGYLDWRFLQPNTFHSNRYLSNKTENDNSLHLFYNNLIGNSKSVLCWCSGSNRFTYRCGDIFDLFYLDFSFFGSKLMCVILSLFSIIAFLFFVVIPFIGNMELRKTIGDERQRRLGSTFKIVLRTLCQEYFLKDLRLLVIVFQLLTLIFICLENSLGLLLLIKSIGSNIDKEIHGSCRALAAFTFSLSFTALLFHWSHIVDRVTKSRSSSQLSKTNIILFTFTYGFNTVLTIMGVVTCIVIKRSFPIFVSAALSMVFLPPICMIGFTIYGIRIYYRLKQSNSQNFRELRFTKFIIALNILLLSIVFLACCFLPTYMINWDLFGVFIGLSRNVVMDLVAMAVCSAQTYILVNEIDFTHIYGQRIFGCFCCWARSVSEGKVKKILTITPISNENDSINPSMLFNRLSSPNSPVETISKIDSKCSTQL